MGNTDSKFVDVYKDFLIQLASNSHSGTDQTRSKRGVKHKNRENLKQRKHHIIPLFSNDTSLSEVIATYRDPSLYSLDSDTLFHTFYRDFISLNDSLRNVDSLNTFITNDDLRIVINANYDNYSNLIRFIILQIHFKLHALSSTNFTRNDNNNNIITNNNNNDNTETLKKEFLAIQLNRILALVRVLTRLIPIYYEYLNSTFPDTNENNSDFLWDNSLDAVFSLSNFGDNNNNNNSNLNSSAVVPDIPPLGKTLLNSLMDLLFIEGFTVPVAAEAAEAADLVTATSEKTNTSTLGNINYGILWELGIDTPDQTLSQVQSPRFDSNRLEIVNLLLALFSTDLYYDKTSNNDQKGNNKFVLELTRESSTSTSTNTAPTRSYKLRQLLTSMVNLIAIYCNNYKQQIIVPYDLYNQKVSAQKNLPQLKSNLVVSCLQFVNILLSETETETETKLTTTSSNHNFVVEYFGSFLRREFDSKLLLTAIVKVFKYPVDKAIEQESDPLRFNNSSVLSPPSTRSASGFVHSITSHSSQNNSNSTSSPNVNANSRSSTPIHSHIMSSSPVIGHRRSESNGFNSNNNSNNNFSNNYQGNGSGGLNAANTNFSITKNNNNASNTSDSGQLPDVPIIVNQVLLLLINLLKYNDSFLNYFSDKFSNKFLIFTIYYIKYYNNNPKAFSTLIPLCYNISLFLTTKNLVLYKLFQTFTTNYYTNKLPNFYKILSISNCNKLTYRDFALIQLVSIAMSDISNNIVPKPYVYELIYNILPINSKVINRRSEINISGSSTRSNSNTSTHSEDVNDEKTTNVNTISMAPLSSSSTISDKLSYNAAVSLLNLLTKLSSKSYLSSRSNPLPGNLSTNFDYLTSPAVKLDLLALLLRAMLITIVHYYKESKNLLFFLTRHQLILYQIKDTINFISKGVADYTGSDNNNNNNGLSIWEYLFAEHLSVLDYSVTSSIYTSRSFSESAYYLIGGNNSNTGSNLNISSPDLRSSNDSNGRCNGNSCGNDKNDNVSCTNFNRHIVFNKPLIEYPDTESEVHSSSESEDGSETETGSDSESGLGDSQTVPKGRSTILATTSSNSSTPASMVSSHVDRTTDVSAAANTKPPYSSGDRSPKRKPGNESFLFGSSFDTYTHSKRDNVLTKENGSGNKLDEKGGTSKDGGNLASNTEPNRNIEFYEHPDFPSLLLCDERNGDSKHILAAIRPTWPVNLTERAKLKAPKGKPLSAIWTGSVSLKLLMRMVRIIGSEFPDIAKVSRSADYVKLMREIDKYEDNFWTRAKYWLPIPLRSRSSFAVSRSLQFSIMDDENKIFNEWAYKILWSDTFETHSTPYVRNSKRMTLIDVTNADTKVNGQIPHSRQTSISSPTLDSPALEKWTPGNSATSRFVSNGSSISVPESNQDVPPSPIPVEVATGSRRFSGTSHSRKNSGSSSSFFRFSWSRFSKGESQESAIGEEMEPVTIFSSGMNTALVDPTLLKVNIWTDTDIKLFPIATEEKEEFSLLDMTSSFLKKLRFGSGGSGSETRTRSSSSGNLATNSGSGGDNSIGTNTTSIISMRPNSRMLSPTTDPYPYSAFGLSKSRS